MRRPAAWRAVVAVAALLAPALAGCRGGGAAAVPRAPAPAADQDVEIGCAAAPCLEQDLGGRLEDLAVQAYVRTVGERVARATPMHTLPCRFVVLASGLTDVVALPGGPVYVTRGLLEHLETEGQLAGILAHQMAHQSAGHVSAEIRRRAGPEVFRAAASAVSGIEGYVPGRTHPSLARIAAAARELQYSPDMEDEADRLGLDYLVAAGYNPSQMIRLLDVLAAMRGPDVPQVSAQPGPGGRACCGVAPASRAAAIRTAVLRKYPDRGGRVGREEYRREVLDRLRPRAPEGGPQASNGDPA